MSPSPFGLPTLDVLGGPPSINLLRNSLRELFADVGEPAAGFALDGRRFDVGTVRMTKDELGLCTVVGLIFLEEEVVLSLLLPYKEAVDW